MLRLTLERESRGWSQAELARRARLHPSELSKIESGRIRPDRPLLRRLARHLGLPAADAERLVDKVSGPANAA
jgi:transcriptional regulator with XRE-family HTH domain